MYKKLFIALTLLLSFYNTAYPSPVDLDIHPNLWITNLQGKLVQSTSLDNRAAALRATSCAISGNSLYIVGYGPLLTPFPTPLTNTLLKGIRAFSPIKFMKGLQ